MHVVNTLNHILFATRSVNTLEIPVLLPIIVKFLTAAPISSSCTDAAGLSFKPILNPVATPFYKCTFFIIC